MSSRAPRRLALLAWLTLCLAGAGLAAAQGQRAGEAQPELRVWVYTLQHQPAREAMALVLPLLSRWGTVQMPSEDTILVRDSTAVLARILPVVSSFDHPAQQVEVRLWLVRAATARVSPPLLGEGGNLPPELRRALGDHFPYQVYGLLAESRGRGLEGEEMSFALAGDYDVRFRLGTALGDRRLRLNDFEVHMQMQSGEARSLLRAHLNVWLGRTMVVALSPGEESPTALMVVVRCDLARPAGGR